MCINYKAPTQEVMVERFHAPTFDNNLARPGTLTNGVYSRVMIRLALYGTVATVPFMALGGLVWG